MRKHLVGGLSFLLVVGCNPTAVEFNPRNPSQHYEPRERSASRVRHADVACDEIGSVRVWGDHDDEIEAIAREVADQGGNVYVLREATGKGRRRYLSGIAYRCP